MAVSLKMQLRVPSGLSDSGEQSAEARASHEVLEVKLGKLEGQLNRRFGKAADSDVHAYRPEKLFERGPRHFRISIGDF